MTNANFVKSLFTLALVTALPAVAHARGEVPFLYQRTGHIEGQAATVEAETAVGTREAGPFGNRGFEQAARVRMSPTRWLTVEGGPSMLIVDDETHGAFATDAQFGIISQKSTGVLDLSLGGGYLLDYEQISVPRFTLTLGRRFGRLNINLSTLVEVPLSDERDAADLVLSTGVNYGVAEWARLGVEAVGQDLEGFWEEEEAEGGAKLVLGPTAWFGLSDNWELRLNAGAIMAMTQNTPTNVAPGTEADRAFKTGFLGRFALGYSF